MQEQEFTPPGSEPAPDTTPPPSDPPPAEDTPKEGEPAEGMRRLDPALGGGEVPIGPLGGPAVKTRERLLAEQELDEEDSHAAERAAIDAAKETVSAEREEARERSAEAPVSEERAVA